MKSSVRRLLLAMFTAAMVLGLNVLPAAALQEITVKNYAYQWVGDEPPQFRFVNRGERVTWDVIQGTHTVTESTPMALFHSGQMNSTAPDFSYKFIAAGTYEYHCNRHDEMTGVIRVQVTTMPQEGPTGSSFQIIWASVAAPAGFRYDVQMKGPADTSWVDWRPGTTIPQDTYIPEQGQGGYGFRARLRERGVGASRWSWVGSFYAFEQAE